MERVVLRSKTTNHGAVAQLVERFVRIEEVVVSITISSTNPPDSTPEGFSFSYLTLGLAGQRRLRLPAPKHSPLDCAPGGAAPEGFSEAFASLCGVVLHTTLGECSAGLVWCIAAPHVKT